MALAPLIYLVCRNNKRVASLVGHQDFSFAVAWHPQGWLLATGNQDTTSLVWDMRYTSKPLAVLGGTMGAIRSLRFSPDGRWVGGLVTPDDDERFQWMVVGGFLGGVCRMLCTWLHVFLAATGTLCKHRPRPVTTT
jgi:hypothetical protein